MFEQAEILEKNQEKSILRKGGRLSLSLSLCLSVSLSPSIRPVLVGFSLAVSARETETERQRETQKGRVSFFTTMKITHHKIIYLTRFLSKNFLASLIFSSILPPENKQTNENCSFIFLFILSKNFPSSFPTFTLLSLNFLYFLLYFTFNLKHTFPLLSLLITNHFIHYYCYSSLHFSKTSTKLHYFKRICQYFITKQNL